MEKMQKNAFFDVFWRSKKTFFWAKNPKNDETLPTNRPPPQIKHTGNQNRKSPTFDREIMWKKRV
jgi:hypothetical protein